LMGQCGSGNTGSRNDGMAGHEYRCPICDYGNQVF
jgi:hypothetical protein